MKTLEVKLEFCRMPSDYTCEGKNISPKIEIYGLNAISMALIVDDPDAPSGTFTHWTAWNMEPIDQIPEDLPKMPLIAKPIKAVQGLNSFGKIGYLGPCPPKGKEHRYFFKIYGLDEMLDLNPGASKKELENAMRGHILQQGEAIATYGR